VLVHFQNPGGSAKLLLFGLAALGLGLAELSRGAFGLAGEVLAVDANVGECAVVLAEGHGHRERGFGIRMVDVDVVFHFGDAERIEVGLDGGGAVELPGGVDERLDELGFGSASGPVFSEEGLGVTLISGMALGGQDDVWPVNPWRKAFSLVRRFPDSVRGPVDL
jgi:hypothetical protein